jgi:hypothetical protein
MRVIGRQGASWMIGDDTPAHVRPGRERHMFNSMKGALALGAMFVAGLCAGQWLQATPVAAQSAGKVFELRTYTSPPGKLNDLHARFRNHTLALFEKHGMTNIGYWVPADAPLKDNTLIYIVSHESREAAARSWKAFGSDPEWQKVRTASEVNGRIVEKVESVFMTAIDYSKIK